MSDLKRLLISFSLGALPYITIGPPGLIITALTGITYITLKHLEDK